jgi:hypothetical protein
MQREPSDSQRRWNVFVVALNLGALALFSAGVLRALQRGLLAGAVPVLLAAAIVVGNARAHDAARRVGGSRRDLSWHERDEGGEVPPPPRS